MAEVTYRMVLEDPDNPLVCYPTGPSNFKVVLMDRFNRVIPGSPYVTSAHIGQTITAKVMHLPSGNNCWGTVTVFDNMPPLLVCPPDTIIGCASSADTSVIRQPFVSDCSGYRLTYSDWLVDLGCQNPTAKLIRTWRATDSYGNTRTCEQTIFYKQPTVDDVQFPPNRDDIHAPAISCDSIALFPNLTEPAFTGFPSIDGTPIYIGSQCSIGLTYSDQRLDACGSTFKILRTWTIVDWCTSQVKRQIQLIKISDNQPPVLTCGNIQASTTSSTDCVGTVVFPPATVFDNCSNTIFVKIFTPFGVVTGNGGSLTGIPTGTHNITYEATDECGNSTRVPVVLTVTDHTEPIAICRQRTTITLGNNGTATLPAYLLDEGSYDNCCLDFFQIKRMDEPDSSFAAQLVFNCQDTRQPVNVIMRVWDCNGNYNECMVQVRVDEKLPPTIQCPPDITLDCFADVNDLNITGSPLTYDGCGVDTIFFADESFLNQCNEGSIKRTWEVRDLSGNRRSCEQTITLVNRVQISVTFPADFTLQNCATLDALSPDSLPANVAQPVISGRACGMVGVSKSDDVFYTNSAACIKVLRKWRVVDWCKYDASGGLSGVYEKTQILTIMDNVPPVIHCPADTTILLSGPGCTGTVHIPPPTVFDCNPNVSVRVSGDLGDGLVHDNVALGNYRVEFFAEDGCGNAASCSTNIVVKDGAAPNVRCLNSLSLSVGSGGEVEIQARDFDASSDDNCTDRTGLQFRIERIFGNPSTQPPADSSLVFDCDDVGFQIPVAVWVGDQSDNWDYCVSYLEVQDNGGNCQTTNRFALGGAIYHPKGGMVENVEVRLSGNIQRPAQHSVSDGSFRFENLPSGQSFFIEPFKNDDYLNGATTWDLVVMQQHILNIKTFDNPLKYIAADLNRDGQITVADMLILRKSILRVFPEFPGNTSWRFVDKNYVFQNPANPLVENFPEARDFQNLDMDCMDANFWAVKVGDVDFSARTNALVSVDDRSENPDLALWTDDAFAEAGQVLEIPFYAAEAVELAGGQFSLTFEKNKIEFLETVENEWIGKENTGLSFLPEGVLLFSFAKAKAGFLPKDAPLFILKFRVKKAGAVSQFLKISPGFLHPEIYVAGEERRNPVLKFLKKSEPDKLEIFPNPMRSESNLRWQTERAGVATLTITDETGRLIFKENLASEKGWNQYRLDRKNLPAAGLYFVYLKTEKFEEKKVLIAVGN